jgi:hypothetical protein
MRSRLEVLLFTGSLVAASLGATASATAATPPAHLNDPCGANNSCNLTVTDNLGSSVTVTLPPAKY